MLSCLLFEPKTLSELTGCDFVFLILLLKPMSRPELIDFEGISMVHYFTDNWENIQNFQARPDDILIATYPKAGVWALLQGSFDKNE